MRDERVLAGKTVIGDLVVSKATGKNVAVVAVPVKGRDGAVAGVLGASIVWDKGLVFTNPKELGPEVDAAFTEMLSKEKGTVRYTFRDKQRTVVFKKSPVTG